MNLTPRYSLQDFTASNKAAQLGIDNTPPPEAIPRLTRTAEMMERVSDTLGFRGTPTSAYRCRALNTALKSKSQDHVNGDACDFIMPAYGTPYQIAKALAPLVSVLGIGQLIYERLGGREWVHVSTKVPERPVNRVITISSAGPEVGIQKV